VAVATSPFSLSDAGNGARRGEHKSARSIEQTGLKRVGRADELAMPAVVSPTLADLRRMHEVDGMTCRAIAARVGKSERAVSRTLNAMGVGVKRPRKSYNHRPLTYETLRETERLYVEQDMSMEAVADAHGVSRRTVGYRLSRCEIQADRSAARTSYLERDPGWVRNDALRRLVESSDLSLSDIARRLGWMQGRGMRADTSRLRRVIGCAGSVFMRRDLAVSLCDALNVNPSDIGLSVALAQVTNTTGRSVG